MQSGANKSPSADFGKPGRAWVESDYESTDLETVIQDLLTGQYANPLRVISSTPSGRALLQMASVFAEFEREMLRERVNAGLARARAQGKKLGRPRARGATDAAIRKLREQGLGVQAIRRKLGCGASRVQALINAAR